MFKVVSCIVAASFLSIATPSIADTQNTQKSNSVENETSTSTKSDKSCNCGCKCEKKSDGSEAPVGGYDMWD